ncbi:MAG: hypothetical protein MHMPM18_000422 [Marteilia pararefringens]
MAGRRIHSVIKDNSEARRQVGFKYYRDVPRDVIDLENWWEENLFVGGEEHVELVECSINQIELGVCKLVWR